LRRGLDDVTTALVEANLGLVRSYVGRFSRKTGRENARDFFSAGTVGLMHAICTYEVGRGTFGHGAYQRIKTEVLAAVRFADHPTISAGDFAMRPAILMAARRLGGGNEGRIPTCAEIAVAAGATVNQVRRVLEAPSIHSLSNSLGPDSEDGELVEVVPDTHVDVDRDVLAALGIEHLKVHGLSHLDARELFVIVHRFGLDGGEPQHLRTVGEVMGISRETVRQIEIRALATMRSSMVTP
jgi:RNA polymerase sigma factor (sigma-70 family)